MLYSGIVLFLREELLVFSSTHNELFPLGKSPTRRNDLMKKEVNTDSELGVRPCRDTVVGLL